MNGLGRLPHGTMQLLCNNLRAITIHSWQVICVCSRSFPPGMLHEMLLRISGNGPWSELVTRGYFIIELHIRILSNIGDAKNIITDPAGASK